MEVMVSGPPSDVDRYFCLSLFLVQSFVSDSKCFRREIWLQSAEARQCWNFSASVQFPLTSWSDEEAVSDHNLPVVFV